jgi:hypothetical protein
MFTGMGTEGFAGHELLSSGEQLRKRNAPNQDELTAQETQIARPARDGLSNSEIAARLFASRPTARNSRPCRRRTVAQPGFHGPEVEHARAAPASDGSTARSSGRSVAKRGSQDTAPVFRSLGRHEIGRVAASGTDEVRA